MLSFELLLEQLNSVDTSRMSIIILISNELSFSDHLYYFFSFALHENILFETKDIERKENAVESGSRIKCWSVGLTFPDDKHVLLTFSL